MPNIPTENAPSITETQPNSGTEAFAQAGRRISGVYHEEGELTGRAIAGIGQPVNKVADDIEQEQGRQEVTKGIAQTAQANMGLEQQYKDYLKANPNDPNAGAKFFQQNVMPTFSKMADQYQTKAGQAFAMHQTEEYGRYWGQKVQADAATLAGHQAVNNFGTAVNAIGSSIIASGGDTHALQFGLDQAKQTAAAAESSVNVPAGALDAHLKDVQEQLVVSAVHTQAQRVGGEVGATAIMNDPQFSPYLRPEVRSTLNSFVDAQTKAQARDARMNQEQARQDQERASQTTRDNYLLQAKGFDPQTGQPAKPPADLQQQIVGDTTMRPQEKIQAINYLDRPQHPAGNAQAYSDLAANLTNSDPTKRTSITDIIKARADQTNPLNDEQENNLTHAAQVLSSAPASSPEGATMAAAKAKLTYGIPGLPGKDPKGQALYANFVTSFLPEYRARQAAGKTQPNDLDLTDPTSFASKMLPKRTAADMLKDRLEELSQLGADLSKGTAVPGGTTAPAAEPDEKEEIPTGEE